MEIYGEHNIQYWCFQIFVQPYAKMSSFVVNAGQVIHDNIAHISEIGILLKFPQNSIDYVTI